MTTHVIILCQGTQKRMRTLPMAKQLLPLSGCGGVPILARTLCQLEKLGGYAVTVVGWPNLRDDMLGQLEGLHAAAAPVRSPGIVYAALGRLDYEFSSMSDPGNSSLRGISRYLKQSEPDRSDDGTRDRSAGTDDPRHTGGPTIVLLGDVVYSWKCLRALGSMSAGMGFVGTSDITESTGELWGVAWAKQWHRFMMKDLDDGMLRHPPFQDEYQPGQMRRWMVGWHRGRLADRVGELQRQGSFMPVDDYTMDVDLPEHIAKLEGASLMAANDDRMNGLVWS